MAGIAGGRREEGGSYAELLGGCRAPRPSRAIFGFDLALAGVIGCGAIGFFSFDLLSYVMNPAMSCRRKNSAWSVRKQPSTFNGENALVRHYVALQTSAHFSVSLSSAM